MNTLDYISLALGGGVALAAVVYALYTNRSLASKIADMTTATRADLDKLDEARRNALTYQQQRDTLQSRADKAEAELADLTAQLKATQAALAHAKEKDAEQVADSVRSSPDAPDVLGRVLQDSSRSDVPDASNAGTGYGHQG